MDYFNFIVNRLNHDDLSILHTLYSEDSTNVLKATSRHQLIDQINVSDFTVKRSLSRLEAMRFVEIANGKKHHQYFISEFGQLAIQRIAEEERVQC